MEELIKDNNIINFFVDVTYKIIPKRHRKYKLLTITGVNKNNLNSYLCGFILIQYETHETFYRVFKYLYDMFDFNPIIVNIDYSKSLSISLFKKDYNYYNYYKIFDNPSLIETSSHFFSSNNIEESLYQKWILIYKGKK